MSSVVLFLFSASMVLFQISCKKDAKADNAPGSGIEQLGKILYEDQNHNFWLANYDGSGKQMLTVNVNSGEKLSRVKLSPNGERLFIETYKEVGAPDYEYLYLYSSKIDGSDLKSIIVDKSFEELHGRLKNKIEALRFGCSEIV